MKYPALTIVLLVQTLMFGTKGVAQTPPFTVGDMMSGRLPGFISSGPLPDYATLPANITLTALRPQDFMAPGSYDVFVLDLHNPVDSPYTIIGMSGISLYRNMHPYSAGASESVHSNQAPPGCDEQSFLCAQGSGFPLAPGQSARFAVRQVWSDPALPVGNAMVTTVRTSLRLKAADGPQKTAQSPALTFLRIMNHTGPQNWQIFSELQQSDVPLIPPERPRLQVTLQQPPEAVAGESVALYASVRNIGDMTVQRPLVRGVPDVVAQGDRFNVIFCESDCVIAGPPALAPGDEWLIRLGTLVYRSPWLEDDAYALNQIMLSVIDTDNVEFANIHSLGNIIEFRHSGPPAANPAMQFTARPAMEALSHGQVRDPHTGHLWLPPVHTVGMTRAELDQFLAANDAYQGFGIATAREVETLLENFVLSQQVLPGPLGLHMAGSHDLVAQIRAFILGAGVTDRESARPSLRGVVLDLPLLRPGSEQRQVSLVIRAPARPSISESPLWGLQTVEEPLMQSNPMREATGYWLVRRAHGIRFIPRRPAMAVDDQLWLHRTRVADALFDVGLQRIDPFDTLFRVNTLRPVTAQSDADSAANFEFDAPNATVQVDEAWLTLPDGSTETWQFRLQLIPDSNPPVLRMLDVLPAGQAED